MIKKNISDGIRIKDASWTVASCKRQTTGIALAVLRSQGVCILFLDFFLIHPSLEGIVGLGDSLSNFLCTADRPYALLILIALVAKFTLESSLCTVLQKAIFKVNYSKQITRSSVYVALQSFHWRNGNTEESFPRHSRIGLFDTKYSAYR